MNLESKQLLVTAKAFSRGNNIPLDPTSAFENMEELQDYIANNPTAYDLQLVTVRENGELNNYILNQKEDGKFEIEGCGPKTINIKIEQKINEIGTNFATKWEEF